MTLIIFKRFVMQSLEQVDDLDERHRRKQLKVTGTAYGEPYDRERHVRRFPFETGFCGYTPGG